MKNKERILIIVFVICIMVLTSSFVLPFQNLTVEPFYIKTMSNNQGSTSQQWGYTIPLYSQIEGPPDVPAFGFSIENLGDIHGENLDDLIIGTAFDFGYPVGYREHQSHPEIPYWAEEEQANFLIDGGNHRNYSSSNLKLVHGMSSFWSGDERSLGDVNGDGYNDVISCLWTTNGSTTRTDPIQELDVWYGSTNGLPQEPNDIINCVVTVSNGPPEECPIIDFSGIGDVNGDGYNDLIVIFGPKYIDNDNSVVFEFGVFYGSDNGFNDKPNWIKMYTSSNNVQGISYGGLENGDFNGDGFIDILWFLPISYYSEPETTIYRNEVFILYGSENGLIGEFDKPYTVLVDCYVEGFFKRLDYNGDKIDDLVVHTRKYRQNHSGIEVEEHHIIIFTGSRTGLSPQPYQDLLINTIQLNNQNSSLDEEQWYSFKIVSIDIDSDESEEVLLVGFISNNYYNDTSPEFLQIVVLERIGEYLTINTTWKYRIPIDITTEIIVTPAVDVGDFDEDDIDDIAIGLPNFTAFNDLCNLELQRPAGPGSVYIIYGGGIAERMRPIHVREGPRLFAGYKTYGILVNANPGFLTSRPREIRLRIDPSNANITLVWNRTMISDSYYKESDPENYLELESDISTLLQDERNQTILVLFQVLFNWNWPHEELCDAQLTSVYEDGKTIMITAEDIFWVENDLDLVGTLLVTGGWNGILSANGWVRTGEEITLTGLSVVYEDTIDVYPPSEICKIKLFDNDGDSNVTDVLSGVPINISLKSDAKTDLNETLSLDIIDLPVSAQSVAEVIFHLRVDGDPPIFLNPIPSGEDWYSSHDVLISITAEDILTSGVDSSTLEYSYKIQDANEFYDWTRDLLQTTPSGPIVDGMTSISFPDGDANFIRWRTKDLTGNGYVISEEYQIKVDTENVSYSNPYPTSWQNRTEFDFGVVITDLNGSGIEATSVQYRISLSNLSSYDIWSVWTDGTHQNAQELLVSANGIFSEGQFSFVQWRAKDIAGNGYTTSPHYRIKVDLTSPKILRILPREDEKQTNEEVRAIVEIKETLSGLDSNTVQYALMRDGEWSFGDWINLIISKDGNNYIGSFKIDLHPGLNNTILIRARDIAGNEVQSETHRIWVNRPPIARISSPKNGTYLTLGEYLSLDASGSSDPDSDNITYQWYLNNNTTPFFWDSTTIMTPPVGNMKLILVVTDTSGAIGCTEVLVTVLEPSEPTTENIVDLFNIILVIVIIILFMGLYLYLRKRRILSE